MSETQVVNEETVILVAFLILATGIGRSIAGPWGAWAQGKVDVRSFSATPLLIPVGTRSMGGCFVALRRGGG